MSSSNRFNLPSPNESVIVTLPSSEDLTESELLSFTAFKTWLRTLNQSLSLQKSRPNHPFHKQPYSLRSITVQSVDRFGGDRIGFLKIQVEVKNDDGDKLPGSIFLRGGAVGMLMILKVKDTEERYVVMTKQARIPTGSLDFSEIPAGMLDDSGSFSGAAAKEISEELGIEVKENELIDLTKLASEWAQEQSEHEGNGEELQRAMYPSAGGCDEFVALLHHEQEILRDQLEEWRGKLTGLRDEGEKITLKLVRLEDLWWQGRGDSKALAAIAIYEGLRRAGRIS